MFFRDKLMELGVRICVIGNLSLLPQDLQDLINEVVSISKNNTKATLNVALSYTSKL